MPRVFVSGTILAGQSLSAPLDCRTGTPQLLFMPAQWTSAGISYQLSQDGVTYYDLFDRSNKEITVNVRAGTVIRLNPEWTESALGCWLKIRSGSSDRGIVQAADRTFTLLVNT